MNARSILAPRAKRLSLAKPALPRDWLARPPTRAERDAARYASRLARVLARSALRGREAREMAKRLANDYYYRNGGSDAIGARLPGDFARDYAEYVTRASRRDRRAECLADLKRYARDVFFHYGPRHMWPGDRLEFLPIREEWLAEMERRMGRTHSWQVVRGNG